MSSGRPLSCTYSNLLSDFSSNLSHRFFHFLKPGTDDRFALLNGDHATRELTGRPCWSGQANGGDCLDGGASPWCLPGASAW
jgi:hypothetical protein